MSGHVCNRRLFLGGVALAPLVLAGCGGEQADAAAPPEITYGRDVCSRCGMIISEERYAAGLVAGDGTAALFDDLGEMLQSVREEGLQGRRAWVHDWARWEWIDATSAVYVRGEQETPGQGGDRGNHEGDAGPSPDAAQGDQPRAQVEQGDGEKEATSEA